MIPGRGRVLLRRVESGESYPGGHIIIPETVRDALMAQHAEVVAVGLEPWCEDYERCSRRAHIGMIPQFQAPDSEWTKRMAHPVGVKAGDWVLVAKRAGVECGDDTGKLYLANADEVLAVLEP